MQHQLAQQQQAPASQGQFDNRVSRLPGRDVTTGGIMAAQQAQQLKQATPLLRKPVLGKASAQLKQEQKQKLKVNRIIMILVAVVAAVGLIEGKIM